MLCLTSERKRHCKKAQEAFDKIVKIAPKASVGIGVGVGFLLATVPVVGAVVTLGAVATGVGLELKDKIKGSDA
ncbi:hypothetical protein [Helicobacter cynogastricus]|uniref:hypothetical protein n=1 Tax=Helicobacter cynogastricus TaxID=329937 RepID=UPI000CF125DD|nr:hypothetical protein [Helicobacter cynogastricus]